MGGGEGEAERLIAGNADVLELPVVQNGPPLHQQEAKRPIRKKSFSIFYFIEKIAKMLLA